MASVNKVILVGNLGNNPELRHTTAGQSVCNFCVGTSDKWYDKSSGQYQERTEWHRIVVWGKQGETCAKYLKKGRQVYIEGHLQTHGIPDPKDATQKRYFTEIVASVVQFLGNGNGNVADSERDSQTAHAVKEEAVQVGRKEEFGEEKPQKHTVFSQPEELSRFTQSEPLNLTDDPSDPFW